MKKSILSAIMMLFAITAMADQDIDNGYRWYLQGHLTGSYSGNEDMRYAGFSKGLGFGGDLSVGYNFNDFWGMSLDLGLYGNKGAYLNGPIGCNKWGTYKYTTFEPTVNVNYNLTNGFLGYKPYRRNALYAHVGFGAAFSFGNNAPYVDVQDHYIYNRVNSDNQTGWKGSIGLNYVYMFNNRLAFTADATAHVIGDNVNGADWQVPMDARAGISVGLRVYLNRSSKPSRQIVHVDELRTITDTITVVEKVVVDDQDVYPIFFDVKAQQLGQSQKDVVSTVAAKLQANPSRIVYVLGYADKATEDDGNAELAKNRADAITRELISLGIHPDRIVTHDMGDNVQPFLNLTSKNRSTICIITDLKH